MIRFVMIFYKSYKETLYLFTNTNINMRSLLFYIIILLNISSLKAQFKFSGQVNDKYKNATAYLTIIEEYQKSDLLITENIIAEYQIDSLQQFVFEGDYLENNSRFYKIHIDNCNDAISDAKHLLKHCETSYSTIFIANNTDTISFPLNSLSQLFCKIKQSREINTAVLQINAHQENLLANLQNTKNNKQRKIIYKNCFQKIQKFSKSFRDPLAELYAFHLYANEKAFYQPFYKADLINKSYYIDLLKRLKNKYPKAAYVKQFEKDLNKNKVIMTESNSSIKKYTMYIIGLLLIVSVIINIHLFQKSRNKDGLKIDYKTILTNQEQNIFELMHQKNSNKNIAAILFISVSTVKTHINNIYTKLDISSRKEIDQYF